MSIKSCCMQHEEEIPQHSKITSATFKNTSATPHNIETSTSTFTIFARNTCNIHLKHVEHTLATCNKVDKEEEEEEEEEEAMQFAQSDRGMTSRQGSRRLTVGASWELASAGELALAEDLVVEEPTTELVPPPSGLRVLDSGPCAPAGEGSSTVVGARGGG
jgi:hypothetical protein